MHYEHKNWEPSSPCQNGQELNTIRSLFEKKMADQAYDVFWIHVQLTLNKQEGL